MLIWYAVLTTPRSEERAAAGLRERGFDVFMPFETRLKRTKDNSRARIDRPLWPGYLFVGINPDCAGIYHVRLQEGVRGVVVGTDGKPARIGWIDLPKSDGGVRKVHIVNWLRERQASGEFDYTPARRTVFAKGARAKVTAGQFQGSVGTMTAEDEMGRVRIELEGIFRGGVWMDDDHIEPLPEAA